MINRSCLDFGQEQRGDHHGHDWQDKAHEIARGFVAQCDSEGDGTVTAVVLVLVIAAS